MDERAPSTAAPWVLRASLGVWRPAPGYFSRGMVYLHPPGPRPRLRRRARSAPGLPLWFLTRSAATLRDLRAPGEEVPPDRRHLKGWARGVRPMEVNVEVSDLGTVLQARYQVPEGVWLHALFVHEPKGAPAVRKEALIEVGEASPTSLELLTGSARYDLSVERQNP